MLVLQLAKAGYTNSTGVELNSLLVLYSRWKSFREGTKKVKFVKADIFKTCLEDYDVIVLFGTETIVPQVRPKLLEMKDGAGLILCRFPLQSEEECWKMTSTEGKGIDQTWLYIRTNIC
ncbi:unnamed protein product [Meloidogyne enterolobii]|uniref:Uncharacterized protein n=2 Tax=Meloidogyne enterolobii TaxID=390850 RepID=A0ACB0ZCZ9_MELEN